MDKFLKNQPTWALKKMVFALSLHPWLNTEEENERWKSADFILKTRGKACPSILIRRKQNG